MGSLTKDRIAYMNKTRGMRRAGVLNLRVKKKIKRHGKFAPIIPQFLNRSTKILDIDDKILYIYIY